MKNKKVILPIVLVFILLTSFILLLYGSLKDMGFDVPVLLIANLLLFLVSLFGFFLQRKGLKSVNPHAFVRSVYLSMILKLFLCMIAVVVYISYVGNDVNKPSLFLSMGLYLLYTTIEVIALMKTAAKKNG